MMIDVNTLSERMQRFWPYPRKVFLCGRYGYEFPFSYMYIQFVFRKLQMSALAHFLLSLAKTNDAFHYYSARNNATSAD
jgi:hypothetical protein